MIRFSILPDFDEWRPAKLNCMGGSGDGDGDGGTGEGAVGDSQGGFDSVGDLGSGEGFFGATDTSGNFDTGFADNSGDWGSQGTIDAAGPSSGDWGDNTGGVYGVGAGMDTGFFGGANTGDIGFGPGSAGGFDNYGGGWTNSVGEGPGYFGGPDFGATQGLAGQYATDDWGNAPGVYGFEGADYGPGGIYGGQTGDFGYFGGGPGSMGYGGFGAGQLAGSMTGFDGALSGRGSIGNLGVQTEPGLGRTAADIAFFGPGVAAAALFGAPAGIMAGLHQGLGIFGLSHDPISLDPVTVTPPPPNIPVEMVSPQELSDLQSRSAVNQTQFANPDALDQMDVANQGRAGTVAPSPDPTVAPAPAGAPGYANPGAAAPGTSQGSMGLAAPGTSGQQAGAGWASGLSQQAQATGLPDTTVGAFNQYANLEAPAPTFGTVDPSRLAEEPAAAPAFQGNTGFVSDSAQAFLGAPNARGAGTAQNAALAGARVGVMNQLARNPGLQQTLFNFANAEAGGQGYTATQAYMESTIDRAVARYNGDLSRAMGRDFHPGRTMSLGRSGRVSGPAGPLMLDAIARGSNVANFATGNASQGVGFAGGPQTAVYGPPGRAEGYGVEGRDLSWARSVGYFGPASTARGQMLAARGRTAARGPQTGQPGSFRAGTAIAGLQGTPGATGSLASAVPALPTNILAMGTGPFVQDRTGLATQIAGFPGGRAAAPTQVAQQTINTAAQQNLNPTQAVEQAANNAAQHGLPPAAATTVAAVTALQTAMLQGMSLEAAEQAAIDALTNYGMELHEAQTAVEHVLEGKSAPASVAFETPGIQNFFHGMLSPFAQLFSLPPSEPQDIAREAPFYGDIAAGKGVHDISTEVAAGKGVHDTSIVTAAGKGTFNAPTDTAITSTPDTIDFSGAPSFDESGFLGPASQTIAEAPGPQYAQQDLGPQQSLNPVDDISPLASVELDQGQIDPEAPNEPSPEAPGIAPPTSPAPAATNPTIASSPPASSLNNNQSAQVLLAAGLPSQSLQAFIGAGLEPHRLLKLLQEGWAPGQVLNLVGRFAQDEEPHADGGRVDRYADFPESENIEDRRLWDEVLPKRTNFKKNWDPDYEDRPSRGLARQLGRDAIPSRRRSAQ